MIVWKNRKKTKTSYGGVYGKREKYTKIGNNILRKILTLI